MDYVLHYAPDNASLIVRLAFEDAGIPYQTRLVNRAQHEQKSAAYRRLNPAGLIPVLETPDGTIFETGAILTWLSEQHNGFGPRPGDADRADFLRWLFYTSNTLHPALRMMFYPKKYIGLEPSDQIALRHGLTGQIKTALGTLDDMAAQAPQWLATSSLRFYLACCLRWCALYPKDFDRSWFRISDTPHLKALCDAVDALPATAAAHRAEGLGPTPFSAPSYPTPPEGSAT